MDNNVNAGQTESDDEAETVGRAESLSQQICRLSSSVGSPESVGQTESIVSAVL